MIFNFWKIIPAILMMRQKYYRWDCKSQRFNGGQFADARKIFSKIKNLDPPASAYEKKCQMLMESPPENWQGIWVMTSK